MSVLLLTTCSELNKLKNKVLQVPPSEQYADLMREAVRHDNADAAAWLEKAAAALEDSVVLSPPFRELGILKADRITAAGLISPAVGFSLRGGIGNQEA